MTTSIGNYLSGIVCTDNGYLLLPDYEEQKGDKPVLLESAGQLWLKLHPQLNEIQLDHDDNDNDAAPMYATEESVEVEEGSAISSVRRERFQDMTNKVAPVLEDIGFMRDRERFLNRQQREEREIRIEQAGRNSKVKTLERQQEAHAQQKQENNGNGTSSKNVLHDEEQQPIDFSAATFRFVKTINSIRAIYPLLLAMCNHESRDDLELMIGKVSLKKESKKDVDNPKRKKKKKCWLLGRYVFDIVTKTSADTMKRSICLSLSEVIGEKDLQSILSGTYEWKNLASLLLQQSNVPPAPQDPLLLLNLNETQRNAAVRRDVSFQTFIDAGRGGDSTSKSKEFANAVGNLKQKLEQILSKRFRGCRLEIYGSCMSDLSIGKASDVDISIHIPVLQQQKDAFERGHLSPKKYEAELKRSVFSVKGRLSDFNHDIVGTQAVARARVPVVKGTYLNAENPHTKDGSIDFDICFFNDIAVRNSALLREYTLVDPRVKALMLCVKKWAKMQKISSAAEETLSSYAWMVLAIFYLQQINVVPNLQSKELMSMVPYCDTAHRTNALDTSFCHWRDVSSTFVPSCPDTPVSVLLYGFFQYYATDVPKSFFATSMKQARLVPKQNGKLSLNMFSIEDPFETFSSHCPHDLASPVSKGAQIKIMRLLKESQEKLKACLLNGGSDDDFMGENSNDVDACTDALAALTLRESVSPTNASTKKKSRNQRRRNAPAGNNGRRGPKPENKSNEKIANEGSPPNGQQKGKPNGKKNTQRRNKPNKTKRTNNTHKNVGDTGGKEKVVATM